MRLAAQTRPVAVLLVCLAAAFALAAPIAAEAQPPIEAGASQNSFYIEPSYNGTSISLFGSVDLERLHGQAFDVAVTIEGPARPVTVWKKGRRAGLWVNSESLTFRGVPNYYAVLSTRPAAEIAPLGDRKAHEIGLDALALPLKSTDGSSSEAEAPQEFKDALIRLKQSSGLFTEQNHEAIEFVGTRLFRAHAFLPPAAGAGLYRVKFYVLQNGKVTGKAGANIRLRKVGIEARVSWAALQYPWLYGAAAILIASVVGSGASFMFRRA